MRIDTGAGTPAHDLSECLRINFLWLFYNGEYPGQEEAADAVPDDREGVEIGEPGGTPPFDRPINFGPDRKYERHQRRAAALHMVSDLDCPVVKTEGAKYQPDVKSEYQTQQDNFMFSLHSLLPASLTS
jgi:hypothetical protein